MLTGTNDLRRLRFFVELASDLHFGRSARRQHVSQSTLSQQIRRLEAELGTQLFDRPGRAVTLTPAGGRLLPEAVELLEHVDRFNALATGIAREAPFRGQATGDLRAGRGLRLGVQHPAG